MCDDKYLNIHTLFPLYLWAFQRRFSCLHELNFTVLVYSQQQLPVGSCLRRVWGNPSIGSFTLASITTHKEADSKRTVLVYFFIIFECFNCICAFYSSVGAIHWKLNNSVCDSASIVVQDAVMERRYWFFQIFFSGRGTEEVQTAYAGGVRRRNGESGTMFSLSGVL